MIFLAFINNLICISSTCFFLNGKKNSSSFQRGTYCIALAQSRTNLHNNYASKQWKFYCFYLQITIERIYVKKILYRKLLVVKLKRNEIIITNLNLIISENNKENFNGHISKPLIGTLAPYFETKFRKKKIMRCGVLMNNQK